MHREEIMRIDSRTRLSVLALFVVVAVCGMSLLPPLWCHAQQENWEPPAQVPPASPPLHEVLEDIRIPMRDGQHLLANVWLPKHRTGPVPTILIMTPYNKVYVGAATPDSNRRPDLPDLEHYALVIVDWRGFYGSEGAKTEGTPPPNQLGKDGHDTIEWIAGQEWSDAKIGMWGPSALGFVQLATAIEQPPHLACIVPMVNSAKYSYERYYYGGVIKEGYVHLLETAGYGPQTLVRSRPKKDAFWITTERTASPRVDRVEVPTLWIAAWFDHNGDLPLQVFDEMMEIAGPDTRRHSQLLIGPWRHIAIGKLEQGELEFPEAVSASAKESTRFFDHWLRGRDSGYGDRKRVRYFLMGADEWREAPSFPPPNTVESRYYLRHGGVLAQNQPEGNEQPGVFKYDPTDPSPTVGGLNAFMRRDPLDATVGDGPRDQRARVESRSDCLVYTTPVLDRDAVLEGTARLELHVSSDRPDTDFSVRLCDVYPDGRSMLVADGIWRMRHRNSLENEEWMEPGQIYEVTVPLPPTAQAFVKGHRIRVIVSSSNFPRFGLNSNLGPDEAEGKTEVATNRVFHDREHPSVLILPGSRN
jgi:predicted acyl esterase